MLLKRYKVQVIEPSLQRRLSESGKQFSWLIVANDLPSAWRKFCTQHFSGLQPNPADYDISFHSTESV